MKKSKHSLAAVGLSMALAVSGLSGVVLGGSALAGAQESTTTTSPAKDSARSDSAKSDSARTPEEARKRHQDRILKALKPLVTDGTISQAQADAVAKRLATAGAGVVRRHDRRVAIGYREIAEELGMSQADLAKAIKDGKTIEQIAEDQGVDLNEMIDSLIAKLGTRLDQSVEAGKLTREKADQILDAARKRLTTTVKNENLAEKLERVYGRRHDRATSRDNAQKQDSQKKDSTGGDSTDQEPASGD